MLKSGGNSWGVNAQNCPSQTFIVTLCSHFIETKHISHNDRGKIEIQGKRHFFGCLGPKGD